MYLNIIYDIKDDAHYMEYKPLYENTNLHTKKTI